MKPVSTEELLKWLCEGECEGKVPLPWFASNLKPLHVLPPLDGLIQGFVDILPQNQHGPIDDLFLLLG